MKIKNLPKDSIMMIPSKNNLNKIKSIFRKLINISRKKYKNFINKLLSWLTKSISMKSKERLDHLHIYPKSQTLFCCNQKLILIILNRTYFRNKISQIFLSVKKIHLKLNKPQIGNQLQEKLNLWINPMVMEATRAKRAPHSKIINLIIKLSIPVR